MSLVNRIFREDPLVNALNVYCDPYMRDFRQTQVAPITTTETKTPVFDLVETQDKYIVKAEVPGFTKESIDIILDGNMLHIQGDYEKVHEKKDEDLIGKETLGESFIRSVLLEHGVDPVKIEATLENGVLKVVIQKIVPGSDVGITFL